MGENDERKRTEKIRQGEITMTNDYDYDYDGLPTVEKITKNKIDKKFLCKDTNEDRYIDDPGKRRHKALASGYLCCLICILLYPIIRNIFLLLYPIIMYDILTLIALRNE